MLSADLLQVLSGRLPVYAGQILRLWEKLKTSRNSSAMRYTKFVKLMFDARVRIWGLFLQLARAMK